MQLPIQIRDYIDFYVRKEHATNMGTMFRGKDKAVRIRFGEVVTKLLPAY